MGGAREGVALDGLKTKQNKTKNKIKKPNQNSYNYNKTKNPPLSIEHVGCSIARKQC